MKTLFLPLLVAGLTSSLVQAAPDLMQNPVPKGLQLTSIGPIAFAPGGTLLIAEPGAGAIVAIATGDAGPVQKLLAPVEDAVQLIANALQTQSESIEIADLTINPESGKAYFAVRDKASKSVAIAVIDSAGKASRLDLASKAHLRVTLPASETGGALRSISDLAFASDRILATGQCNEEFSSKIYSVPLPLSSDSTGQIYSAETYHVAHGRWETKAPITSFTPYDDAGVPCVVGAFACTPIAKFPLANLDSGAHIKGTSVVELGGGNRPLDVFTYEKNGERWFITQTQRFHGNLFGPSKFWGVRVSARYLNANDPAEVNENAARRDVKSNSGPDGIEVVDALFGAVQVAKVDDETMAVLREAPDNKLRFELCALP